MTKIAELASRRHEMFPRAVAPVMPEVGSFYGDAIRELAGGVSVITVGTAPQRTGFTASSVVSVSVDPPRLLVSGNRDTSWVSKLNRCRCFGVNMLAAHHTQMAVRFSGRRVNGEARFAGECWHPMETGASLLCDALAAFDCELEEVIERHSHAIAIGRVVAARRRCVGDGLVYWRGGYHDLRDGREESGQNAWEPILRSRNVGCG